MEGRNRVIKTTTTRRVIKKTTKTSTEAVEIPVLLLVWWAACSSFFLSVSFVVPFVVTRLHDDYFKPYLNALRWNESALWQLHGNNNTLGRVPWSYDWFPCLIRDGEEEEEDRPIVDAFHPLYDAPPTTPEEALDSVLYFGMTVLPHVLDPSLTENLRQFVLNRVEQVTVIETIPVLTHSKRISFGLNLREDPSIAAALHALANNRLLTKTLEGLLGPNPAIVELSTIIAHPGAKAQPWHADSNPNTLIYDRHFTQVFTVLIPLQKTTHDMGATWVCPGTHRCQPPPGYCENGYGFSISTTNGTTNDSKEYQYWRAGDALLYSSDTHHRGGAHVDWNGPPRTVLILSLTSQPSSIDQATNKKWLVPHHPTLPIGPVFGIRWDHWGLAWNQFQNKDYLNDFIEKTDDGVLRVLRAMGLYDLEQDQGWTFMQAVTFGMMNDMMGYRFMDLEAFLNSRISPLASGLPSFLQGRVQPSDSDYAPVPRYLSDVGRNLRNTAIILNLLCLAGLAFFMANPTTTTTKKAHARRKIAYGSFVTVYLSVAILGTVTWMGISSYLDVIMKDWFNSLEEWNKSQSDLPKHNGLAGPASNLQQYLDSTVAANINDVLLVEPKTLEETTHLSQQWINYHPGTRLWKLAVRDHAASWVHYNGLPAVFRQAIIDHIILSGEMTSNNQPSFLRCNLLGGWERLSRMEAEMATVEALLEYWTLPMVPQHWGPPILHLRGPCLSPKEKSTVLCSLNSARMI